MRRRWIVLLCCLATTGSPAAAVELPALLAAVAENARFPATTRADVRLERRDGDATASAAVVLLGRGRTLYVETRDGLRALVRPGKIVVRADGRVVRAPVGARVAGSDLLLEDLVPVGPHLLRVPQVSDEGPTGTVVTGAPAFPSARVLVVLTIDPDGRVPTRVKYYEKSISDLAAFRKDEAFVDVGGRMRPTRVTIDRTREGTSTRLDLAWRAAPEVSPGALTLRGLRAPSPVAW